MNFLAHHILALSLTAGTTFVLGLFVFLVEPRRRLNQVFGLYSLAISWWALTETFLISSPDQATANLWFYLVWPGVIFIAPTFTHTVFFITEEKLGRSSQLFLRAAYTASFIFLLLHLFTNLVSAHPRPVGYAPFHNRLMPLGVLVPLTFLILVYMALWRLWQASRKAAGERRTRLRYLFWGSVIGYLGGSPDWCFAFGFHIPFVNPFGIYGVPMYSAAMAYAVFRHQLFDVHVVIRRSLVYSLLVTLLTVGYFGFVYGVERLFQSSMGYTSRWLSLSAFALMALFFQPLKIGIQRVVDWLIFRVPQEELVKRMERLEEQALQAEKFKAVSTLAAGMAHEIKNPLTALKTFAEYLPEKRNDPAFLDKLQEILTVETTRIRQIVQDMLDFAKPKAPELKAVDLRGLIDSTVNLLSGELVKRNVQWAIDCQHSGSTLQADSNQIRQVLINLIQNAADAMPEGGTLTLTTRADNRRLELAISDTGHGIPPELLPKIFDPFITTKPDGNGLGLAVVYSIIQAHHGTIRAESIPGRGTTFTVRLPI